MNLAALGLAWTRALEDGGIDARLSSSPLAPLAVPLAFAAERAWARASRGRVAREIPVRAETRVVAVGGATLGGSGKTPLALACVVRLAEMGAAVALIGHAYRAAPREARVVHPADPVDLVGDEALACARELARRGLRAPVVVAPRRRDAVVFAEREIGARVLVLDAVAQTSPRAADLALLAVDSGAPWGSGRMPPRGDLRAEPSSLARACDLVVAVGATSPRLVTTKPVLHARTVSRGAFVRGQLVPFQDLQALRLGLLTSLARPSRITNKLAGEGLNLRVTITSADHAPVALDRLRRLGREHAVDLWLASPKCAAGISETRERWLEVAMIHHELAIPMDLEARLAALV